MEPAVPEVTSLTVTWTYPGSVDATGEYGYIDLYGQHILTVPLATAEIGAITPHGSTLKPSPGQHNERTCRASLNTNQHNLPSSS